MSIADIYELGYWLADHPVRAVLLWYAIMGVITFLVYWKDKRAARRREWRTSERTLHRLEFLGGWIGAWIAQAVLNHKCRKESFLLAYAWVIFWHLLLLAYFSYAVFTDDWWLKFPLGAENDASQEEPVSIRPLE